MKKKGFTLVELIAVIAILALLLSLVTISAIKFYNSRVQKDYENIKSIIEDSAKVFINTDSDVYSEVDDKLQEAGSCKILYDRLVDARLLDKDMTNPVDKTALYNNNKYIKITLDDSEYSYEFMDEDDANIALCITNN